MIRNARLARARCAVFAGALLSVLASTALAQSGRRTHVDPRSGAAWAWSGSLSAPSTASPASIAQAFAAGVLPPGVPAKALAPVRTAALPRGGSIVVLEQHASPGGLRVVGGEVAVRIDAAGRVRWAASRARALPSNLSLVPSLGAEQALAVAGWIPGRLPGTPRSELVVHAPAGREPRLAYRVTLPLDPVRMEVRRVFVDAQSGRVLVRDNLVRESGQARAFAVNPVETPGTQIVQLAGLEQAATTLTGPDAFAESCIDNRTCIPVGDNFVHACAFEQTALADENGDFLAYDFVSDTEPEDAFAEVQIFHHTMVAFARARELGGFDGLDQPLRLVANRRASGFLDADCDGTVYVGEEELQPLDNAFFSPADLSSDGRPALIFGQGSVNDFSYDGDVVYHEFGHAVMFQIAPDVVFEMRDRYGVDTTPGGLHEGYADLMTMFVTDDPELAEYASVNFGVDILRNLDNDRTCPAGLVGEGHLDSEVMTGAIWAAREALPEADRTVFDQAVFAAQRAFGASDNFLSAAQLTLMEVEVALGPDAAEVVAGILTARGFDDCEARVVDAAVPHRLLYFLGGFAPEDAPRPSVVQWRLVIDEAADAIQVDIGEILDLLETGNFELDMEVLVKPGSEPIFWTEGSKEEERTADYTVSAPFVFTDNEGVVSARAVVDGPFEPGEYHLQLAGRQLAIGAQDITISTVPAGPPDAGLIDPPDAGGGGGGGGADGDGDGCGCRSARPDGSAGGVLLLLGFFWLRSRRR